MKNRNIPFGYQFTNGVITLHPTESQTVREIFHDYLHGSSLLQIAKKLNDSKVEYLPSVTGWNKARLKRLLDDTRYLGNETYPQIIEQDAFSRAQKMKAERNTQKAVDRTAEIFQMTIPVACGECGQPMRRIHDSRTIYGEKWICQSCGMVVKISDKELVKTVTEKINTLIANPQLIYSVQKSTEPSIMLCRMENEIGRMLDSPSIEKEKVKNKIFECASLMYSELDTTQRITELLKVAFEKSKPLSSYNRKLTERTVTEIALHTDKSVELILKNGQRIRKEQANAADSNNASETGAHHSAHRTADECLQHFIYPQAGGGILPRFNEARGTAEQL